jgi:hypothetical protein
VLLTITFRSEGPAHCILCDKDKKDTTDVQFHDGSFEGPMCDPCFKKAKKLRLRVAQKKVEVKKP